jgi:hypothetical protein
VEQQAVRINKKVMFGARYAGGEVGENQIVPPEQSDEPIGCRQLTANLPFFHSQRISIGIRGVCCHIVHLIPDFE